MATLADGITTILGLIDDLPAEWMMLITLGGVFGLAMFALKRAKSATR